MGILAMINRYPIPVDVYQPRAGGGYMKRHDKLGMFKRKGGIGTEYRLKKLKMPLDPQRYNEFIQVDKKPGMMLSLWNPAKGIVEPMKPEILNDEKFQEDLRVLKEWYADDKITRDEFDAQKAEIVKKIEDINAEAEKLRGEDNGNVLPRVKIEGFQLTADEIAWKENYMNNVEQAYVIFQRKSFMEKYGHLMLLLVFGFLLIFALMIARQDLMQIYEQIGSAAGNIPTAMPPIPIG